MQQREIKRNEAENEKLKRKMDSEMEEERQGRKIEELTGKKKVRAGTKENTKRKRIKYVGSLSTSLDSTHLRRGDLRARVRG